MERLDRRQQSRQTTNNDIINSDFNAPRTRINDPTDDSHKGCTRKRFKMGALLSLPLLAVPSLGTVSCDEAHRCPIHS